MAHVPDTAASSPGGCFDGPGEMRERCRGIDWAATALGPSGAWPESLQSAVQLLLAQPSAAVLHWGPELVTIYNDAACGPLGDRHPAALGRSAWSSAGAAPDDVYGAVLAGQVLTRRGRPFEAHDLRDDGLFVNAWSPIRDASGKVAGVLATCEMAAAAALSAEQLRLALRAARLFAWSSGAEQGPLQYSANYDDVLGFAASTMTSEAVWSAAERARFDEAVAHTRLGHGDLHLEYRLRHPGTSEPVWIETHATRLSQPSGATLLAGVAQNVTARKRLEWALRDSEARQAFLLELGDRLARSADPVEIQRIAAEMLGERLCADFATYAQYDAPSGDAVVSSGWARVGEPIPAGTYRMHRYPAIIGALRAGRDYSVTDLRLEDPPHPRDAVSDLPAVHGVLAVPVSTSGTLVAFFSVLSRARRQFDAGEAALLREAAERTWFATERARAGAELAASERRLRAVLVAGRMAHWRWDPISDRLLAGDALAEMFGLDDGVRAVLLEGQLFSAVHPEDLPAHRRAVREAVDAGSGWHREYRVNRPRDGTIAWLEESADVIRGSAAGHLEVIGLVWEVTGRKRTEAALRESEAVARLVLEEAKAASRQAEAANRAKDEFLATLSHELRTPVAAILLWAGAIRSGAVPTGDLGRALDAIVQSAESQSRLIEDLLDLSRLRSGKLSLVPGVIDVAGVVSDAIDVVRPTAASKGIALEVDVQTALGHAVLDPARLKQVLWILLSNATKFTPPGGHVVVRVQHTDACLHLEVADDGEGIAPEFMRHLFERFRQADMGETRRHGGLGIGLALSRELIELQGGTIEAHSDGRGRGAVFEVRLPWIEREPGAVRSGGSSALPAARDRLRGVAVLLIEDDERTREGMALTLTGAGADVVAVASGEEALAQLAGDRRDSALSTTGASVIVCDIGLPGMSGYELIERIVRACRGSGLAVPPACAVSAYARDVDRTRAIEAGFDLYVAKPISSERLIEVVEDLRDVARVEQA